MKSETGITKENKEKVSKNLAVLLANTYATYLKTQNFHWNLTGVNFYFLHILFESHYKEMAEAIDEIAERIRTLGFYVDASFSSFEKLSSIPHSCETKTSQIMLQELVNSHETIICQARKSSTEAEKENDNATVDLLARRIGVHEKFHWMLRSHLE